MGRVTEEFCDRCGKKIVECGKVWFRAEAYKTLLTIWGLSKAEDAIEWDLCQECAKSLNEWLHREVEMRG